MKKILLIVALCCMALCGCKIGDKPKVNIKDSPAMEEKQAEDKEPVFTPIAMSEDEIVGGYLYFANKFNENHFWLSTRFALQKNDSISSSYCNTQYFCFYLFKKGSGITKVSSTNMYETRTDLERMRLVAHHMAVLLSVYKYYVPDIKNNEIASVISYALKHTGEPFIYRGLRVVKEDPFITVSLPADGENAIDVTDQILKKSKADSRQESASGSSLSGEYTTDKHNIRITDDGYGNYRYTAWKKPKEFNQGDPDLEIDYGQLSRSSQKCYPEKITFEKGNLKLVVFGNSPCSNGTAGEASGQLFIFINGVKKDHYWMYR